MAKIVIDREKCKGCLLCVNYCLKGLISIGQTLNKRGIRPVEFSRQANLSQGGIPPPAKAGSRKMREKAGKDNSECIGCAHCAIICPDCCIEVYK